MAFVVFFLLSFVLSFFAPLSFHTLTLQRIPVTGDSDNPDNGFPIKDLKIINKEKDRRDVSVCDITILNTNASMIATNVSVMDDGNENDYTTYSDHIAPGKTYATTVATNSDFNTDSCANVYIKDAGIVKTK